MNIILTLLPGFILALITLDLIHSYGAFKRYFIPLNAFYSFMVNRPNEYAFEKRIGDYAYFVFSGTDIVLVYNCEKRTSCLFRGSECVVPDSVEVDNIQTKISDLLIARHTDVMLTNLYVVNNTLYSRNLYDNFSPDIQEYLDDLDAKNAKLAQAQAVSDKLNLDDILQKINSSGYDSLTDKEKEFLDSKSDKK